MSGSVQPTGSQNSQNAAVENKSVGQFEDWEVINKDNACCEGLPEKVRSGFSLGRSIGRAWRAVKEGVSAFFQKLFGKKSKAPTGLSGVGVSAVSAKNGEPRPPSNMPPLRKCINGTAETDGSAGTRFQKGGEARCFGRFFSADFHPLEFVEYFEIECFQGFK